MESPLQPFLAWGKELKSKIGAIIPQGHSRHHRKLNSYDEASSSLIQRSDFISRVSEPQLPHHTEQTFLEKQKLSEQFESRNSFRAELPQQQETIVFNESTNFPRKPHHQTGPK